MAIRRSRELRSSFADKVDGLLFAFAGLSTVWLAYLVFKEGFRPGWPMLLLVVQDPDGIQIVLVEVPADHPLRRDPRSASPPR